MVRDGPMNWCQRNKSSTERNCLRSAINSPSGQFQQFGFEQTTGSSTTAVVQRPIWNFSSLIDRLLLLNSHRRRTPPCGECVGNSDHPRLELLFLPNSTQNTRSHNSSGYGSCERYSEAVSRLVRRSGFIGRRRLEVVSSSSGRRGTWSKG
jgi:hypothetical protein